MDTLWLYSTTRTTHIYVIDQDSGVCLQLLPSDQPYNASFYFPYLLQSQLWDIHLHLE